MCWREFRVNAELTSLYWRIGHRINIEILRDGRSFEEKNLRRMIQFPEICRIERWSTRTLERQIQGILFERTGLSKKPEE